MRISKCSECSKRGASSLNGVVCIVASNKEISHLSVHIYACGVCTCLVACMETGRQLKCPAFPYLRQDLFSVHCCIHQASWLGASGDCSFHICPQQCWIYRWGHLAWLSLGAGGAKSRSCVCAAYTWSTAPSPRPNSISYKTAHLFFLFTFFSLIFSSLSFILPFLMYAGTEPPNLLPLFYFLALTPLNTLPSSASLMCLHPH